MSSWISSCPSRLQLRFETSTQDADTRQAFMFRCTGSFVQLCHRLTWYFVHFCLQDGCFVLDYCTRLARFFVHLAQLLVLEDESYVHWGQVCPYYRWIGDACDGKWLWQWSNCSSVAFSPCAPLCSFIAFIWCSGCDTGFGHTTAITLCDAGFTVFAGCLNSNSRHELEKKTKNPSKVSFVTGLPPNAFSSWNTLSVCVCQWVPTFASRLVYSFTKFHPLFTR